MDTITRRDQCSFPLGPRKYLFLSTCAFSRHVEYRNLAILECDPDHEPKTIRETLKGNVRIIKIAYAVYMGLGWGSKGYALAEKMECQVDALNDREHRRHNLVCTP